MNAPLLRRLVGLHDWGLPSFTQSPAYEISDPVREIQNRFENRSPVKPNIRQDHIPYRPALLEFYLLLFELFQVFFTGKAHGIVIFRNGPLRIDIDNH